jgi:hypothetical protein
MFGSLGVLILTFAGGLLFDLVAGAAPFVMLGVVNLLAGAAAFWVWRLPSPAPAAFAAPAR